MNNIKHWFFVLAGIGLAVFLIVGVLAVAPALAQGPGGMMGGFGPGGGMMGQGFGHGWMMGYTQGFTGTQGFAGPCPFGPGMMGGMMGGGMMGNGMMGGGMMWSDNNPFFATEPLSVAEATEAVETYLAGLNNDTLQLKEIMIFDNHAYAEIVETDTGLGAMELLVDPATKTVYPEMGPNMMWNLKYGMMANVGQAGMMMGRFGFNQPGAVTPPDVSSEMTLSPEEAVTAAQSYLDQLGNGLAASIDHTEPFYGYYTLHVSRDGQVVGMLSVNGFSGQVFPHTWHGELVEISAAEGH